MVVILSDFRGICLSELEKISVFSAKKLSYSSGGLWGFIWA
jgi:hypothetical protein